MLSSVVLMTGKLLIVLGGFKGMEKIIEFYNKDSKRGAKERGDNIHSINKIR